MELTWDSQARSWIGNVSRAGPAGTAGLRVGGVWVEFDRVDAGRIVSLTVTPSEETHILLGSAAQTLGPPESDRDPTEQYDDDVADDEWPTYSIDVDLSRSPLWLASRELAIVAELGEDAGRLDRFDANAAAFAYLELAQALRDLDDLAPAGRESALDRMLAQRPRLSGGRLVLYKEGEEHFARIMKRVLVWSASPDLAELANVVIVVRDPELPTPQPVPAARSTGIDAGHGASDNLLPRVRQANELGRDALRLERGDPTRAAQAWRRCADAWRRLGETGRAAIALDRAAGAALDGDEERAIIDRQEAWKIAPSWAQAWLDGRTGRPHRSLWALAYGLSSTATLVRREPAGTAPARITSTAVPTAARSGYVFISYARTGEDRHYVDRLAEKLEVLGIRVRYDRHGDPDREWGPTLQAELDGCAALIVVMSAKGEASRPAQRELERARTRNVATYAILLSGTPYASLKDIRAETVPPGQLIPAGTFLDRLRADLSAAVQAGSRRPQVVGDIPPKAEHFFGRDKSLEDLEARLFDGDLVGVRAAGGTAGVGKSQLAAQYAHEKAGHYHLIAWIDAERPELIAGQLADIATQLGVPSTGTVVSKARSALDALSALSATDSRWLLVFDNFERHDLGLWLPPGGHVIVTSRQTRWDVPTIDVGPISRDDAFRLLAHRTPSTVDDESADGIVGILGGLPLALEQAAGHLAATGQPAADYLDRLRRSDATLLRSKMPGELRRVAAVWGVGRSDLRERHQEAEQLLELCAFLGSEPIPLELYTQHPTSLPTPLAEAARDEAPFGAAVADLVTRGLARRSGDGLSIHRLLAQAVRLHLARREQEERASTVRELLVRHLPGGAAAGTSTPSMWRALMPHVLTVADAGPGPGDVDRTSWLLARAGHHLRSEGEPGAGLLLARAVGFDEEALDPDSEERGRWNSLAATLARTSGREDQALPVLEEALRLDEAARTPDDARIAADLRNLAAVLTDLGRFGDARRHIERALEIDRARYGDNHPQVADDLLDLAAVLNALGDAAQAEQLSNQAEDIDKSRQSDWRSRPGPAAA